MASPMISNPVSSSESLDSKRKKKKKSQILTQSKRQQEENNRNRWKTDAEQQIYSSKLLQALRQVRISTPSSSSSDSAAATPEVAAATGVPRRGRAVREAADRVLAAAAKGRTRWSRAILTNRLKLKFLKHKRVQRASAMAKAADPPKKPRAAAGILRLKEKNLPAVQRKARALGRIVPGCRKEPLAVILEEATDYIPALEMQVRAMAALAELLSGSGAGSSSSSQPGPSPPPPA